MLFPFPNQFNKLMHANFPLPYYFWASSFHQQNNYH